jgi:hypothetical protein
VLDYPLNLQDNDTLRNKSLMDEVNNNFLHILKKVPPLLSRPPSKPTRRSSINFKNQVNWSSENAYKNCWTPDHPSFNFRHSPVTNSTERKKSTLGGSLLESGSFKAVSA